MYRKRKTVPPFFRLPVPYNPIAGEQHHLHPPMRPYCWFVLSDNLTTSLEYAEAEITEDKYQWGPGMYHLSSIPIVVHNHPSKNEDEYVFTGETGDIGFAVWDFDINWRIVWMETAVQSMYLGKVTTAAIAAETCGTVVQCDCSWTSLGNSFTVYNPHAVELPLHLKVRWSKYPGWTCTCGETEVQWIVEPWHWTECPDEEE